MRTIVEEYGGVLIGAAVAVLLTGMMLLVFNDGIIHEVLLKFAEAV